MCCHVTIIIALTLQFLSTCTGVDSNLYEDELKESRVTNVIYTVYSAGCPCRSFVLVFQFNMLDVTPSQKFCVNMGPVLTGYGPMEISCHSFGVCVCMCVLCCFQRLK